MLITEHHLHVNQEILHKQREGNSSVSPHNHEMPVMNQKKKSNECLVSVHGWFIAPQANSFIKWNRKNAPLGGFVANRL